MKANTRDPRQWVFILIMVGCLQLIVLIAVAMFYYPGGTESNHDAVGYSLSNYLSDLGRQTAFSGDPNVISRSLFGIAGWGFGLLLCPGLVVLPRLFAREGSARRLATLGSIFGVVGAISNGIAFVIPWDIHPLPHGIFGTIYGIAFFVGFVLYSAAILRSELHSNACAYTLLAAATLLVLFAVLTLVGETVEAAWGSSLHGTVDVMTTIVLAAGMFIQGYGGLRVREGPRDQGLQSLGHLAEK